jgi:hypothetical protein
VAVGSHFHFAFQAIQKKEVKAAKAKLKQQAVGGDF